jgi:A/G-specific adenine glycosylase
VPVFPLRPDLSAFLDHLGPASARSVQEGAPFLHVLTHRDLHLHPVIVRYHGEATPDDGGGWFTAKQIGAMGLPAPVRKLLAGL